MCGTVGPTLLGHITRESHVALHFNHLDPVNAMMPLIMLLASHDIDTSTSGVISVVLT